MKIIFPAVVILGSLLSCSSMSAPVKEQALMHGDDIAGTHEFVRGQEPGQVTGVLKKGKNLALYGYESSSANLAAARKTECLSLFPSDDSVNQLFRTLKSGDVVTVSGTIGSPLEIFGDVWSIQGSGFDNQCANTYMMVAESVEKKRKR